MTQQHLSSMTTVDMMAPVRWETVTFVGADGRRSSLVTDVLPEHPAVSLPGLAVLLANPALWFEFMPRSVWCGVELERTETPWPRDGSARFGPWLAESFRETLTSLMGDAENLAVAFSGGLDSLGVLYNLADLAAAQGRRVTALVVDSDDDRGRSSADVAIELVQAMNMPCQVRVIPGSPEGLPEAAWSYGGPRFDAEPRLNRRMAEEAAAAGCDRLFFGSGADELMQTTQFSGQALWRARRWRALATFLRDMQSYGGLTCSAGELVGIAGPKLSRRRGFALAASLMFGEALQALPERVLSDECAGYASDYHAQWLETERALLAAHDHNWAAYSAWHAICPVPFASAADSLSFVEPYGDPAFNDAVAGLALDQRYDEKLATPYHRLKALVVHLIPQHLWPMLPRRKQTYSRALERYSALVAGSRTPDVSLDCGLLREDWERDLAADSPIRERIGEIEMWLRGALAHGATIGREPQ
jgi:hypothetical protein